MGKQKGRIGRPLKINPALVEEYCTHIERGAFRGYAAALCKIDQRTIFDWLRRGQNEPGTIFETLKLRVEESEARYIERATTKIEAAASSNPRHLQWLLSRRFPAQFSRRDNVDADRLEADASISEASARQIILDRMKRLLEFAMANGNVQPNAGAAIVEGELVPPAVEFKGDGDGI